MKCGTGILSDLSRLQTANGRLHQLLTAQERQELWAQAAFDPKEISSNSEGELLKRMVIMDILGELSSGGDRDIYSNQPTPLLAIAAFVHGSLKEKSFSDPLDQKRRSACRNFKF